MSKNFSEHEYKGIKVWYDAICEMWRCLLNENRSSEHQNLTDLRKRIDAHVKREKNFQRFEVVGLSVAWKSRREYSVYTVTSIMDDNSYWVVDAKGSRSKQSPQSLARNTPENQEVICKIIEIEANAESLGKQAAALLESIQIKRDEPEEDDGE